MRAHPTLLQLHAEEQAEAARAVQCEAERRALLAAYKDVERRVNLWSWVFCVTFAVCFVALLAYITYLALW